MNRTYITDDSGRWFDASKAIQFLEDRYWDGRNMVSKATGSQWDHQTLHYTASGKWVLECSSQWQGSMTTFELVDFGTASLWLVNQDCLIDDAFGGLPDDIKTQVSDLLASKEL